MSKRLGGMIGCKDKTSSWHLIGLPNSSNVESTVSCQGETHRDTVHLHQSPCRYTKKVVAAVVSHIFSVLVDKPKTTLLHGGQPRSWSAEQRTYNKTKSLAAHPPPHASTCLGATQVSAGLASVQGLYSICTISQLPVSTVQVVSTLLWSSWDRRWI